MSGLRYLKAIRLSMKTDESTSPERQDEHITREAERRGMVCVGEAIDLNVSASKVEPFERPELGPWLTERYQEYDAIIWWRMDRAFRSMRDLHTTATWAKKHRKVLIFASGPGGAPMDLDMSSPVAELIATILAFAAQMESQAIIERTTSSNAYLRRNGRWAGGTYPYGYLPVRNMDGAGWVLVENPDTAPVLRELIDRVIDGHSISSIVDDFNARGVPSPRDDQDNRSGKTGSRDKPRVWSRSATRRLLGSRALLGETTYNGRVIADSDGMPVPRAKGLISPDRWARLQERLDAIATHHRSTPPKDAHPLLGTAFCQCGYSIYRRGYVKRGKPYVYAYCPGRVTFKTGCTTSMLQYPALMADVKGTILAMIGNLEVMERRFVAGSDDTAKLQAVEDRMSSLRDDRVAGLYDGARGDEDYRSMYRKLQEQRDRLAERPLVPDGWEYEPTGRNYREMWEEIGDTDEDLRTFIGSTGIRVTVHDQPIKTRSLFDGAPDSEGSRITVTLPPDLAERVRQAKRTARVGS